MTNKSLMWKRALAWIIDIFILAAVNTILYFLLVRLQTGVALRYIIYSLIMVLYFTFFEITHFAATPGKAVLNIWICYEDDRMLFLKSLGRLLLGIITNVPLGLGFFRGCFSESGKTISDIIFNSAVVTYSPDNSKAKIPCVYKIINNQKELYCEIPAGGAVFGRDPNICNAMFPADTPGVSRSHCVVKYNSQTGLFMIEDLCSSYGTYLNTGEMVQAHEIKILEENDKFYLADKTNLFCVGFKEATK